ncbi:MATE family efflux transporter (plasmid) [Deinococcus metallilatus]|uniref:Multidrug-efflux transporter n=1 Tax=Deinococcus metallilatus TaxID=1211322 RepID=A0AAJ5K1D2_9DEIO|nr:MATE family efflux transporter [Deinococcus metallilatus]MBB5293224.1 MATE family multidrug resistance protein [Deinococcus metallilatus]QBY07011.1 MATE family efflux transporter [Deinococcus metallilatus]RXJ18022.1 MATE family efflux transporter [Deinococcus metallilatus]TLK31958.1 MATE family efflux transporter [Deinococcus metallilatus]GMA15553.1 putative multidrug resistance protein NorM [Deinococcus metallilatus]
MLPTSVPLPAAPQRELAALVRLAAPVVVSQFASNALTLVSTAVIGRLGAAELAAAAYANATYYLVFIVLLGMLLAVGPRAAQAHGAGDGAGVALALRGGLILALLLAALALPLMWGVAALLPGLAPTGIRADLAATYLRVYALGMLPVLVFTALRGTLEGTGRPRTVTAVALGGVALVALLSPALAFGWGPLPRLGLAGAAAASALTSWATALTLLPVALRRAPRVAGLGRVRSEVRALLTLGWPIGLTLGAEGGMFSVTALLMARFGSDALAAHNLALQVITAVFMIPLGLATATGIRVAHAAGAGDRAGARRAGLTGIGVAAGVMLAFALLELLAPRLVLGVFVDVGDPQNAALIGTATVLLTIAALFQTVDGVQVTANAALRGLHDTRWPLLISLTAYWLVGLGVGSLLAFGLGLGPRGLWFGLTAGLFTAAGALLTRFLRRTRAA